MTWGNKDLRPSLNATGMTIRGLIALVLRNQRCQFAKPNHCGLSQSSVSRLTDHYREMCDSRHRAIKGLGVAINMPV